MSRVSGKRLGLVIWWKPFHAAPADVNRLKALLGAGKVKPAIDRTYPLSHIVDALRYVNDGRPKGKVVITV